MSDRAFLGIEEAQHLWWERKKVCSVITQLEFHFNFLTCIS